MFFFLFRTLHCPLPNVLAKISAKPSFEYSTSSEISLVCLRSSALFYICKPNAFFSGFFFCQLQRLKNSTAMRLIRMNGPELPFLMAGCLCSTLSGACQPIFAILYSEVYRVSHRVTKSVLCPFSIPSLAKISHVYFVFYSICSKSVCFKIIHYRKTISCSDSEREYYDVGRKSSLRLAH